LRITHIEIKDENDEEIKKYSFKRDFEIKTVNLSQEFIELVDLFKEIIKIFLNRLINNKVIFENDIDRLNSKALIILKSNLSSKKRSNIYESSNNTILYDLSILIELLKNLDLLKTNGIALFYEGIQGLSKYKMLNSNGNYKNLIKLTKKYFDKNLNHPKLEVLTNIIKNFDFSSKSKIIIFSQYRFLII
jgi:ERCC4-related helicase